MVAYSKKILDLTDECERNKITQARNKMARKMHLPLTPKTRGQQQRSKQNQAKFQKNKPLPVSRESKQNPSSQASASNLNHPVKEGKVAADVECRNCKKIGHLAKICVSHIFFIRRRHPRPRLGTQGRHSSS